MKGGKRLDFERSKHTSWANVLDWIGVWGEVSALGGFVRMTVLVACMRLGGRGCCK